MSDEGATVLPKNLSFTLTRGTQPACVMEISAKEKTAFKVKTTEPKRYLVQPNQGILDAGDSRSIKILMVEKDCNTLLDDYERVATLECGDKFLVQLASLSAEKYSEMSQVPDELRSSALTKFWGSVGKVGLKNKKLLVELHVGAQQRKAPDSVDATKHVLGANKAGSSGDRQATAVPRYEQPGRGGASGSDRDAQHEALKKKFDDLVLYTERLTEERDQLTERLKQSDKDLQREMTAKLALEGKNLRWSNTAGDMGRGSVVSKRNGGSISLLYMVMIAIVFFMGGYTLKG